MWQIQHLSTQDQKNNYNKSVLKQNTEKKYIKEYVNK